MVSALHEDVGMTIKELIKLLQDLKMDDAPVLRGTDAPSNAHGQRASVVYVESVAVVEVTAQEPGGPNTPAVLIE
jgi:hypothetical protein